VDKGPQVLPFTGIIAAAEVEEREVRRAVETYLFPVSSATRVLPFRYTRYYEPEMGPDLRRWWLAGAALASAGTLASLKIRAREWEETWRRPGGGRRVNVDPGYITRLQIVLATTKHLPATVYLRDGIFALVELTYVKGAYAPLPWTYADYAEAASSGLFLPFRAHLLALNRG